MNKKINEIIVNVLGNAIIIALGVIILGAIFRIARWVWLGY